MAPVTVPEREAVLHRLVVELELATPASEHGWENTEDTRRAGEYLNATLAEAKRGGPPRGRLVVFSVRSSTPRNSLAVAR